jgi:hypothetical protein
MPSTASRSSSSRRGASDDRGALNLSIADLRHAGLGKSLGEGILSGGKGKGLLRLLATPAEQGDPDNALVALGFDDYPGPDVTARQTSFVPAVFGVQPDEVVCMRHDEAVKAASERARAQLPALQKAFLGGLAPGEQLLVKAPFPTQGGNNEWMRVEVTQWKGEQIKGVLRSDPLHVPGLKADQMVDVRQSELFDYLRVFADGRREGNETSELLEAQRR